MRRNAWRKYWGRKFDQFVEVVMDDGIWFFTDDCPAGAVWVYELEDGTEYLEWP